MARPTVRRTARIFLLSMCTIAIVVLVGAVVRQSWITNSATADVVRKEGYGAEMLHSMTSLLAEMVEAQSAAVRGERVDADRLRKALGGVAEIDAQRGVVLQTSQRLADLTSRTESALTRSETGRDAYNTYSVLVSLTGDIFRRIGDSSHLIHDPDLDSYYLMDAAIVRLPEAMVFAGRASDLVTLAGGKALPGRGRGQGGRRPLRRVRGGRTGERRASRRPSTSPPGPSWVRTSPSASTPSRPPRTRSLHPRCWPSWRPQWTLRRCRPTRDASPPRPTRSRICSSAELQALLDRRGAKLAGEWRFTAVSAGLAGAIGLMLLWLVAVVRPRHVLEESNTGDIRRADDLPVGSAPYGRHLVEAEELVHVGRSVRPRHGRQRARAAGVREPR